MVSKSVEFQKIYRTYKCSNNHSLQWTGKDQIYSSNACYLCNSSSNIESPIRWSCEKCLQYYCNKCYPTFASDHCPCLKHKMTLTFNPSIGGTYIDNFTCDMCFKNFQTTEGMWIDIDCDYTMCQNCQKEGDEDDIPKIIED